MSSDGSAKLGPSLSHSDTDAPPRPEPLDELILNDDEPIELPPPVRQSTPPLARAKEQTPSVLPPPTPPPRISTRVKAPDEPVPPTRPKMTLRIPDDEITRPSSGVGAPMTPDGGVSAIRPSRPPLPRPESTPPSRSRLLSAPPVSLVDDPSRPPVADAFVVATAPAAGIDSSSEAGWTPFSPPVEHVTPPRRPSMVDDVASNGAAHDDSAITGRYAAQNPGPPSEEIPIDMDLSSISSAPDTQEDPGVTDPRLPASLDSEDVRFDDSERGDVSEDEVDADDLVSVESLAPAHKKAAEGVAKIAAAAPVAAFAPIVASPVGTPRAPATNSQPPAAPVAAAAAPSPALRRSPGSLVFAPGGGLAPPPMTADSAAARKKTRPWWEELFNDDFIRTMAKVTDAQINKEVTFIEESLGCEAGAMVLDLACGTGRHAVSLAERGYQVVGFDLSLAMLARASDEAQDRKQKINFVQGDMREMTFEETFDGVYSWNTSFGYFDEEKNGAVIARVHKALKKGGQFLLDVVNRDYIVKQAPSLAWFEGDGCICMDEMTIDFITSRMKVKRTLMMDDGRTKEIEYSIRAYSLHELGKMLHDNGFRVAEVSGRTGTPGVFFGCESPRTLILAEKR